MPQYLDIDRLEAIDPREFRSRSPYPWAEPGEPADALGLPGAAGEHAGRGACSSASSASSAGPSRRRTIATRWSTPKGWRCRSLGRISSASCAASATATRSRGCSTRKDPEFRFHWHYTPAGCSVSPHCDSKREFGSHIWYFNAEDEWDPQLGRRHPGARRWRSLLAGFGAGVRGLRRDHHLPLGGQSQRDHRAQRARLAWRARDHLPGRPHAQGFHRRGQSQLAVLAGPRPADGQGDPAALSRPPPASRQGRLPMKPTVFIHTNHRQYLGALVSAHSLRRNSRHADEFDVRIIQHKDYPFFARHEGESFLRDGVTREWHNEDLQSFTPLRFMPPELMGYQGRALVIDPDIFAVGDVWELLARDMAGQGDHVPDPTERGQTVRRRALGQQRHAARLREAHPLAHRGAVRRAVHARARLSQVGQPGIRAGREHRHARARVERLRPAHAQDQDGPQHAAQDPALEDRAARGLPAGRALQAVPAGRLAAARPPAHARRIRAARPATAGIPTTTRRRCSSACCASASRTAR